MDTTYADSEFGDGVEQCYFEYMPSNYPFLSRYRCQNDITAQAIVRSGSEGIGRYEIGKMMGQNTRTKAGNRRISASIQLIQKSFPNQIGSYQKMEGKYRMLKYFYKCDNASPIAFAEMQEKLEKLIGREFPYTHEATVKFPGKNLSTLRITDITLRRFLFILELLQEEGVVITTARISKTIKHRENELGYTFDIDKKSLMKCLYALEKKQLCRVHTTKVCETGFPEASTSNDTNRELTTIQIITPYEIRDVKDERVQTVLRRTVEQYASENRLFPTGQIYYNETTKEMMKAGREEAIRKGKNLKKTQKTVDQLVNQQTGDVSRQSRKRRISGTEVSATEEEMETESAKEETTETNCISSLLPSEFELWRRKKAGVPLLSQKTLDAVSHTSFRRQCNAHQTLTSQSVNRKIVKHLNRSSVQLTPPIKKKTPKKKTVNKRITRSSAKAVESNVSSDEYQSEEEKVKNNQKRKLDAIDEQSQKQNMYMRSRFIAREYDMLVMIRALSFFLNPIHRFWLNPTVMRDIMHEYNPESRCKTVNSLMSASAREMVRPGRIAQMHYIVKTLGTFKTMVDIRNTLVTRQFSNENERNDFFKDTFRQAHQLIFHEARNAPLVTASDDEFRKYLEKKKHVSTVNNSSTFPRRSCEPTTAADVAHCVAFNVVMSTMVCEAFHAPDSADRSRTDFRPVLNSVSPSNITDALLICRSEGLITRVRPFGAAVTTRSHTILSVYYRQFFNHPFRNDLIEIAKSAIKDPAMKSKNVDQQDDNPLGLLCLLAATCNDVEIEMDLSKLDEVIPRAEGKKSKDDVDESIDDLNKTNGDMKGKAVKQLRHLENSPLFIEKIGITCPENHIEFELPSREEIAKLVTQQFDVPVKSENKLKEELVKRAKRDLKSLCSPDIATVILDAVNSTEYAGITVQDILEKLNSLVNEETITKILELLIELGLVFTCGVETKRYVGLNFAEPWFIKIDDKYFGIRPWSFPNGEVNWNALRWMSEALLLTINYKPGIKLRELCTLYSYVLQPICLRELISFLEKIECVLLDREERASMKKLSPFSDVRVMEVEEFAIPTAQSFYRFAHFFHDIQIAFRVLKYTESPSD
ncbi:hypothetical protein M3Y95_01010500 [Aphelenchoides besseyi]|nr:hypothetical protein M3Y95_01010500 [Aphelenchoides besseyi]